MAAVPPNPLLSSGRASDSSLSVQLHPLVLLTISDYVTRHTLRRQEGPIVGAIIGQQNGREVTMEHAFECKLKPGDVVNGEQRIVMDDEWFADRLDQFKDVHKAPALDLVALFTLAPLSGPLPQHLPIIQQLQHHYNDSLLLLLFHPESILGGAMTGGKLPISLYEAFYEPGSEAADKSLQVDGWGMGRQLQLRFRELGYEIATAEAEMIGIDFVAKGGGNASAVANAGAAQKTAEDTVASKKGKAKAETNGAADLGRLSAEDEELMTILTGKANAIKMLHQRITLIKTYLASLPPSYLTDATLPAAPEATTQLNHPLLRNISSMLSRLPLLAPPSATSAATNAPLPSSLGKASMQEKADVHLVSLLSSLTRAIADAKEFGTKYAVVQRAKTDNKMSGPTGRGGPPSFGRMGSGMSMDDWPPESGGMEFT